MEYAGSLLFPSGFVFINDASCSALAFLSSERVLRWPNGALSVISSWLVGRVAQGIKLASPSVRQLRRKRRFLALKFLLLGVVGGRGFGILQIGFVFR